MILFMFKSCLLLFCLRFGYLQLYNAVHIRTMHTCPEGALGRASQGAPSSVLLFRQLYEWPRHPGRPQLHRVWWDSILRTIRLLLSVRSSGAFYV